MYTTYQFCVPNLGLVHIYVYHTVVQVTQSISFKLPHRVWFDAETDTASSAAGADVFGEPWGPQRL